MLYDEPLVRLDADAEKNMFSISSEVNTKRYHDAFAVMPLPKPVIEALCAQAGRILQRAAGKNEEYLVAIDARTGLLVADNLKRPGHPSNTTFSEKELRALRSHAGEVITIHNHPHSLAPSYQDVLTASRNELVAGSVILGHDGSVWYISARTPRIAEHLRTLYNAFKESHGDRAEIHAINELIKRARKVGLVWMKLR